MKKTKIIRELRWLLLVAVISILGCGSGSGGGGGGGGGDTATITGVSGSQVALNGDWSAGCVADMVEGESEKEVVTFSGSSFTVAGNEWLSSTTCSGSPDTTFSYRGTFTLGEEGIATLNGSPVTATKADIAVISALLTIHDPDVVAFFNTNGLCGVTDWVVESAKNIVGTDCIPANFKDIMCIDDTADPDLFYSAIDEEEGGTLDANGYPEELDAEAPEERLTGDGVDPPAFSFTFAFLQYRTYDNPVSNRYQGFVVLTKDGAPIQSADILDISILDSARTPMVATSEGFWAGNYMNLNCSLSPCTQDGPVTQNGFWATLPTLAVDTYSIEVDTADGQLLTLGVDYPGQLELPIVTSTTMQSQWLEGDLVLNWTNPTGATNWSEVDQLRILVFDGTNKDILNVRTGPTTDTVTIPANLVSQAAGLGDGTLARWEVQTRAYDENSTNFARGYSTQVNVAAPGDGNLQNIVPGTWSGAAGFGGIEFIVTSDGSGIDEWSRSFEDFTCDGLTTNTNATTTFVIPEPILGRELALSTGGSSQDESLDITGIFETTGDAISGTFDFHYSGTTCSGTWSASPL